MPEYVSHETVQSVTGALARTGGTRRVEIRLPADAAGDFPAGDVVRLVLDGSEHRVQLAERADGQPVIRGVHDTPSQAREPPAGSDRLADWVADHGLATGRSMHVDVIEPGFKYGVRAPGESATYEATEPPSSSLADIADSLDTA